MTYFLSCVRYMLWVTNHYRYHGADCGFIRLFIFCQNKGSFSNKIMHSCVSWLFFRARNRIGVFYGLEFWTGFGSGLHSGFKITIKDVILNKINKSKIFQIFRLLQQVLLMNNKEKNHANIIIYFDLYHVCMSVLYIQNYAVFYWQFVLCKPLMQY